MSSVASLRRKDNMWIYKNSQGLQVLNDELNQRRKKRSSRHRYTTTTLSPPLSPTTPLEPIIHISKINHVLRPPSPREEPKQPPEEEPKQRPKLVKTTEYSTEAQHKIQQSMVNIKSMEEKNIKNLSVITSSVQEKKDAIMKRSMIDKEMSSSGKVAPSPVKAASPPAPTLTKVTSPPVRVASPPVRVASTPVRVASPPARVTSTPTRVASPPVKVTSPSTRAVFPPVRINSPPIQTMSISKSTASPMSTPERNFLLEAKQKLFSAQQQQQQKTNVVRKSLPSAPAKKTNGLVSSFISAFETAPPKHPKHIIPPSSVSTPLSVKAAAVETIIPISSCSSVVIPTESYFSEVIDRRFSPTPGESTTEEEPIIVYLPQLSPDMSFCTNALDIPQDDISFQPKRPCIKKQVSFSDQLSTFIPDDDNESISTVEDEHAMTAFVRTLNHELSDVSATIVQTQQREKFIPVLLKKKEVQPQKLSNKLLDIFQKKPQQKKMVDQPTSSNKELTHLTKTRARKPPSLKKPTTLTYPAAIAQPDWRTRAITTKKSSVFI